MGYNIRETRDSTGQLLLNIDIHGNIVAVALDPPDAPTLGAATAGDINGAAYQWGCTIVNGQGETTLGTKTLATDLTNQQQSLTMPATAPDGCTFNLYRNVSGGATWAQVTTGLAAGAVYVDDTLDVALGTAAPILNSTRPSVSTDARYVQFGNGDGQTITHGLPDYTLFALDYVQHLGSDFTLTLGDDHITIVTPGIYLAKETVSVKDAPLGSGQIIGIVAGPGTFSDTLPCLAASTDYGGALASRLLIVTSAPTTIQFGAIQTDSIDHTLVMDAAIIRLGDVS